MKKNTFFLLATMFAIFFSLPSHAQSQSDDRYKKHITGGYNEEMIPDPVLVLQQELDNSNIADSTKTETKEPVYQLYGEQNIIRFNGSDPIYAVTVEKHPGELAKLCKELGISASYESRMAKIVLPLCNQGVVLFGRETDPYFLETDIPELKANYGSYWDCYFYRGTQEQNAKLIRNINANRDLFQDGALVPGAYMHWKVVD